MELSWQWLAGVVISGIAGGGTVLGLWYRALKDKLIGDLKGVFPGRADVRELATKVSNVEGLIGQISKNENSIIRLQEADRHRWEPVAATLERINERLDQHEQLITRLTAIVEALEKRVDVAAR